jgi:hypothetical protein
MIKTGPVWRALALVGVLASAGAVTTPAFAAATDIALLKAYIGTWSGRGTLSGANTETVKCKLTLKEGNGDKINYNGRCAIAGTNPSINGTIAYIDAAHHYEAAMTSNATFTGKAVGQKSGDGVIFNLKENEKDDDGHPMTISASIALTGGKIAVQFQVVYTETGDAIRASVPFSK